MEKNQQLGAVSISRFDEDGAGIADHEGAAIRLPGTLPGDVVDLTLLKRRRRQWFGRVESRVADSADRVEPRCEHFGSCGGCKLQHLAYSAQLAEKERRLHVLLDPLLSADRPEWLPIIPSPDQYHFRNKLEFSFGSRRWLTAAEIASSGEIAPRPAAGFHPPRQFDKILHLETCHLMTEPANALRKTLYDFAQERGLSFFDVKARHGLLRTLMVRISSLGEVMAVISFGADEPENIDAVIAHMQAEFPGITSLQHTVNLKGNDTIWDLPLTVDAGRDYIVEELCGLRFHVRAKSFLQTNTGQTQRLYAGIRDFCDLRETDRLLDLYCGVGAIGLSLAGDCAHVHGIEEVPAAIADAHRNASRNNVGNASFQEGRAEDLLADVDFVADVAVVDPPRVGLHARAMVALRQLAPRRIVYVSCNPKALARDLVALAGDYRISKLQPVDMFPHTLHVETIAALERKSE
ncbi:MAG: 23S rRNA (uracil1939-C5)-methyltransferase [Rhodothermales bacterium]